MGTHWWLDSQEFGPPAGCHTLAFIARLLYTRGGGSTGLLLSRGCDQHGSTGPDRETLLMHAYRHFLVLGLFAAVAMTPVAALAVTPPGIV